MFRQGVYLLALGCLLAGCAETSGFSTSPATSAAVLPSEAPSAQPSTIESAIVGKWRGHHTCDGIANALAGAGFDASVIIENIVGNGLVPGAESPEDVAGVGLACRDAVTLEHSHEFTAAGEFFSYDHDGNEVDVGTYQLVDDDTLTIGAPDRPGVTFDFSIEGGYLTLEPQLEPGCLDFECQWAIMVAMPWGGLRQVP